MFSKNFNLNDASFSFPAFPSKPNLKLHNIPTTSKMVKKVIADSQITSGSDCIPLVVLRNCEHELSWLHFVPQFGPAFFSLYINDLDDVTYNIAICTDDIAIHWKCDQIPEMWQQLEVSFDLGLTCERLWTEIGSELIISMLGKLSLFHLTVRITELLSTRK